MFSQLSLVLLHFTAAYSYTLPPCVKQYCLLQQLWDCLVASRCTIIKQGITELKQLRKSKIYVLWKITTEN